MARAPKSPYLVAIAMCSFGCAKVMVDSDDASFCMDWDADGTPVAADVPPELTCDVLANAPDAQVEPPPASDHHLEYVCVREQTGGCAPPATAEPSASTCVGSEVGDRCGADGPEFGGSCTSVTIWSM